MNISIAVQISVTILKQLWCKKLYFTNHNITLINEIKKSKAKETKPELT